MSVLDHTSLGGTMFAMSDVKENMKDEEVLALSTRDPKYFAVLVDKYEKPFLRKAMHVLRNREDAEDAVQDTFTKIYMNSSRFREVKGARFSSWGYKILLNTCFTKYNKNKRSFTVPHEFYAFIPDLNTQQFERQEETDYVVSVMEKMSETSFMVLWMYFFEGKSHKEIANEKDITVGAVKARMHRAKKEFRKHNLAIL